MKKNIFILAAVIAILVGAYGAFQYNKPHKNIAEAESELVIGANELISKFDKNKDSASNNLLSKVTEISGKITAIEHSSEQTIVILNEGVKCGLPPNTLNITKGEQVKIKGVYSGFDEMFNEISFAKCYLLMLRK